jgi:hypothetical protein
MKIAKLLERVQEYDWLPPVPHGDTVGHPVHRVPMCALFGFPTLFTPDSCLANFRYLKHTLEFGIWYSAYSSLVLVGFSDANFVGCGIDRESTFGTCHFLGSSLVCWSSQK